MVVATMEGVDICGVITHDQMAIINCLLAFSLLVVLGHPPSSSFKMVSLLAPLF